MATITYRDGEELAHTTIVLPKAIRDAAKARKISISAVATEALKMKLSGSAMV